MATLKIFDERDPAEAAVADFFSSLTPGWTVERPAPSIERVSCFVLSTGSVIVTEYQGLGFAVFMQAAGPPEFDYGALLKTLRAML